MIDTHSHIFEPDFADDLPEVIARAKEIGVEKIFMPNIDDTSVDAMLGVCSQYPGYCFPMLGFHPTSVDADAMPKVKEMKKRLTEGHPYIAIGEVGLDLYWDKTYIKEQQMVLEEQIQWALEWELPLVIHCREAFPELFDVLKPYKETKLTGVFHSFTGTVNEAMELLDYSRFMVGINGVVTFKKSTLPEALKVLSLERLVLETDSPYLAPVPFRGKENTPAYIPLIAEALAAVRQVTPEEISTLTNKNAAVLFSI